MSGGDECLGYNRRSLQHKDREAPVLRIEVSAAGKVTLDGSESSLAELEAQLPELKAKGGKVCYWCEPATPEPPEAARAFSAILRIGVPVTFFGGPAGPVTTNEPPILRVEVSASGRLEVDGQENSIEELEERLVALKAKGGKVSFWWAPVDPEPPESWQVELRIQSHGLPVVFARDGSPSNEPPSRARRDQVSTIVRRLQQEERHSKPKNRIDFVANRLRRQNRIDELESELAKFDPDELESAEKESWYHFRGAIQFQQSNRPLAFQRFQEGLKQCPNSAFLSFSLGQEYEFRGETNKMFECFDKAKFPKVSPEFALVEARYSYLWGQTDKAWSYVEPLLPVYFRLKVLDSTFLANQGLPFFQQVWKYLAACSQLEGDFQRLNVITRRAEAECRDLDFDYLKAELRGLQYGDFSALKDKLCGTIQAYQAGKFPFGYLALRLNILRAQETNDAQEAMRLLDSVVLAANDFPWLNDMRLLAKCELARKTGRAEEEAALRKQFLARQPLLFEPDNAVNFNLLRYQESLRANYVKGRRTEG